MKAEAAGDWNARLGAAWLGMLAAVHPLPHTGALRSLLLLIGLVHVSCLFWRKPRAMVRPPVGTEAVLLTTLTAWLLFQSSLVSASPGAALAELAREWGKLLAMVVLGIGLSASLCADPESSERRARWVSTGLFLGAFAHVLAVLAYQAWHLATHGKLLLGEGLFGNYGYVSLLVNMALALLLADAAERFCRARALLPFGNGAAVAAVAATLLANAVLTAKAGLIMTHVLGWLFLAAVLIQGTARRRTAIASVVLALAAATALGVALENRWTGAIESVASGITTAAPPTDDRKPSPGVPAVTSPIQQIDGNDPSFFFRSSWAWIGVQGIGKHPFGLGYGADAFGRYIAERFGRTGFVSSHSGWIDFTLANGIPAIVLLLALSGALSVRGWKAFRAGGIAGLLLCLVVINYIGRCAMDGYLSGSRLTAFAIMAAVLWGFSVLNGQGRHAGSA